MRGFDDVPHGDRLVHQHRRTSLSRSRSNSRSQRAPVELLPEYGARPVMNDTRRRSSDVAMTERELGLRKEINTGPVELLPESMGQQQGRGSGSRVEERSVTVKGSSNPQTTVRIDGLIDGTSESDIVVSTRGAFRPE